MRVTHLAVSFINVNPSAAELFLCFNYLKLELVTQFQMTKKSYICEK